MAAAMELLMSEASPFARKVRVLVRELELEGRVGERVVTTSPYATDERLAEANPLGKIPALLRSDGPTLFDSRVICRYLDTVAGNKLYPAARIWDVLTLEALADGISEAALSMTYEVRYRNEDSRSPDWIEAQWEKIQRALDLLEEQVVGFEPRLDMGQIALACALGYLDLRHNKRAWRKEHPQLAAWESTISRRPAMLATGSM